MPINGVAKFHESQRDVTSTLRNVGKYSPDDNGLAVLWELLLPAFPQSHNCRCLPVC